MNCRNGRAKAFVAYHEAGHAVAAWRLGVALQRGGVTIVPDSGAAGSTFHRQVVTRDIEYSASDRNVRRTEKLVQICLAGKIAQCRYSPHSVRHYQASSDHRQAIDILSHLAQGRELNAWLKLLRIRTENMFDNPDTWRAVQRLAKALVQRKTIRGRQALEIIRAGFDERLNASLEKRRIFTRTDNINSAT